MPNPPIHLWNHDADIILLHGGHRNLVYRTTGLDQNVVFKSTRRSPAAVRWLIDVQQVARASGFVVPWLKPCKNGHLAAQGWTCEDLIEGTPFQVADMREIQHQISGFHAGSANFTQRPEFCSSLDLLTNDKGGDVDLTIMPDWLVEVCRSAWSELSGMPCAAIHADLNPENLIWTPDGRPALLDWDECRVDRTLFDLGQIQQPSETERRAILAWEAACSWQIEPSHAKRVAERLR